MNIYIAPIDIDNDNNIYIYIYIYITNYYNDDDIISIIILPMINDTENHPLHIVALI